MCDSECRKNSMSLTNKVKELRKCLEAIATLFCKQLLRVITNIGMIIILPFLKEG